MGSAAEWLREERRKTLGDWVSFCVGCGHAVRYFDGHEDQLAAACPQCQGPMRHRCPSCSSRFSSVFAVQCEACDEMLREDGLFGGAIRRTGPSARRRRP